jgi:hypothetical protein
MSIENGSPANKWEGIGVVLALFIGAYMVFLLTGCSTISEYNQGCRDGVSGIHLEHATKEKVDRYCKDLDWLHRDKVALEREK